MNNSHRNSPDLPDDFDLLAGIVVRRALDARRRAQRAACAVPAATDPHAPENLAARIVGRVRRAWQHQRRGRADTWRRAANLPLDTLSVAASAAKA